MKMHFGASYGLNRFSDCDIAVIGTFRRPGYYYALLYSAITNATFSTVEEMRNQLVEYNGQRFYFTTFNQNCPLRQLQLYFVESELIQAIGRARILTETNWVYVFSDFPIYGAKTMPLLGRQDLIEFNKRRLTNKA